MTTDDTAGREAGHDFIRDIIREDLDARRHSTVVTRFPPEPNGYLHIGHAKAICLNFGVAQEFGGRCHLRFDDTNPTKEEQEFIDAIERDVRWLGFDWGKNLFHASDYFERLYGWAEHLIRAGKAYVDDQSQDEIRANRGTLTEPGRNSPFRDRGVDENLDLFHRMRAGEFPNGARVLRAKIDMTSGNINLRDPVLYRILHAVHPLTGDAWSIYPSYDFAHGQSDAIEGITHSICTLEFEDHRPLYDWFLDNLPVPSRPHQYEIRAPQPDLHGAVEARAYRARARRPRQWLGRSAHADAGGAAPPRRAGAGHSRLRQAHRRRQVQQHRRRRDARIFHPRSSEQDRAAADGGAAPSESRDRELSRRRERGDRSRQSSRRSGSRNAEDPLRPRALYRARRLHGEPAEEVLPAVAWNRGAAALCLLHHLPRGGEERGRRGRRAALHLRSRDARRQCARWAQGQGDDALGFGGGFLPAEIRLYNPLFTRARSQRRRLRRRSQSAIPRSPDR